MQAVTAEDQNPDSWLDAQVLLPLCYLLINESKKVLVKKLEGQNPKCIIRQNKDKIKDFLS